MTIPALSIAQSGMQAAQTRLTASASNVANVQTENYRRREVSAQESPESNGVQTQVRRAAQPGADLVADLVEQKMAALAFKANANVLSTGASLLGSLLDEKA